MNGNCSTGNNLSNCGPGLRPGWAKRALVKLRRAPGMMGIMPSNTIRPASSWCMPKYHQVSEMPIAKAQLIPVRKFAVLTHKTFSKRWSRQLHGRKNISELWIFSRSVNWSAWGEQHRGGRATSQEGRGQHPGVVIGPYIGSGTGAVAARSVSKATVYGIDLDCSAAREAMPKAT